MNKNILAENMRRFNTKNLSEQVIKGLNDKKLENDLILSFFTAAPAFKSKYTQIQNWLNSNDFPNPSSKLEQIAIALNIKYNGITELENKYKNWLVKSLNVSDVNNEPELKEKFIQYTKSK